VNFGFVRPFRHGFYKHHSAEQHRFLLLLGLPNVVLGLAAILLTFLTARAISGDAWTPAIAAAIVAFVPRFVFLSAFVTNDNLVNALGAALAYCSVRCVRAPGWRWAAAVGAVLGLLLITKVSALPVAAVLIPVALAAGTRKRRATVLAVAAAAVAVVGGWYLVQNQVRYGDPLATSATQHYLQLSGNLRPFSRAPYVVTDPWGLVFSNVPSRIIRGYWYTSGWNQFRWPLGGSLPFWAALAFALSGLVSARLGGARGQLRRSNALLTLGVLAVAGFISVWVVAFQTPFYQPRLALVGLPALGCLAALGLERWRLPIRAVLPLMGLVGTLIAIQHDVLSLPWSQ
jgi:4-amino-4-deoxy-L-arabinose transferase-like glycosyltransferase